MALCKIQIIGNLGRDPELRYTPNGRPVATFSVAVNQATKNQQTGEWVEATDWFRVSVWGDRAERSALFGSVRDGLRPLAPYRWKLPSGARLLEKGERARAWRVASTLFWLLLLGLSAVTALLIVLIYVLANLVADVLYAVLNPRIRYT